MGETAVGRRAPRLARSLPALTVVVAVVASAVFAFWWFSPWESFQGPPGAAPRPLDGVPVKGIARSRTATAPVLVAGMLVERHGGGVRAVEPRTGRTWWALRRPGRVRASTVGAVDGARAAIVWTDRRLTIIDVATGRRRHAELPDRSQDRTPHGGTSADAAVVGLADRAGHPIAAVIQNRGVDAYDAASGRRLWSWKAPAHCGFNEPSGAAATAALSLTVGCELAPDARDRPVVDYSAAYTTLLDASSGRPVPGFARFGRGRLVPVGDHLLLQREESRGYRVVDARTARTLWRLPNVRAIASGGDGLVVSTTLDGREVSLYRARDGRRLWRYRAEDDRGQLRHSTVVDGRVYAVEFDGGARVVAFGEAGQVAGRLDLPAAFRRGTPAVIGGGYGTLVVEDVHANPGRKSKARPYVLLIGAE
ncbi:MULTISPECIES: PQQ-binding-like beta-propeller repeat protein [Actinomadura]|uniref:Pyrrolo-quinoline quinone repeat domain-containing protein n=1 Tax=Actinomadura geliboluensis TaxID=882440 RepID=A0A5S4GZG2_9ACTN|nr:PQQ-binding-like beta-propeller repeat protein [Actinomadura geliboluensis]TMR37824.1 hypothetical protein ETD96_17725 [Actinomadura geliboluensis]